MPHHYLAGASESAADFANELSSPQQIDEPMPCEIDVRARGRIGTHGWNVTQPLDGDSLSDDVRGYADRPKPLHPRKVACVTTKTENRMSNKRDVGCRRRRWG